MSTKSATAMRETMQVLAIGVGVTVIGLIIGAVVVSPTVSTKQRLVGIGSLLAIAAALFAGRMILRALRNRPTKTTRAARQTPAPTMNFGGKSSRTPRAVAALAAAGAAPTEIAWKTGLPVDAVSMLLQLSGARSSGALAG